ncbi:hypothetical protein CR205_02325 [Alteribacter lacisalsi]|uniref:DUF4181 domain-containing protein n=1 Tax=Alteribacter lacisalsi TaxID=2045244 RepID=A0A2W0H6H0_9BACI|nr:DUF4181 domain-containing protein [Alteribacter lacisalsi]PYZ97454.1 hypothetical protein CR205_02325 [Alteribacter lacisalsi]
MIGIFFIVAGLYIILVLYGDKKLRKRVGAEKRTYLQPDQRKMEKSRGHKTAEWIIGIFFVVWMGLGLFLEAVPFPGFLPFLVLIVFLLANGFFQYRNERERREHVLSFYNAGAITLFFIFTVVFFDMSF